MSIHEIHDRLIEQLKRFVVLGKPEYVTAAKAMCRAAGIEESRVRSVIDESIPSLMDPAGDRGGSDLC